ncbi:MAG: RDD family protein [Planctomycetes bacterium]|nr:RDD family protein [Planctomycetota bacterium]
MSQTVVSNRFSRDDADECRCEVVTPEGVPLVFRIGRYGDRVTALFIDGLWILLGLVVIAFAMIVLPGELGVPLGTLAFFLLRNGYFLWHEVRSGGRTPGKRRVGLRVVDAGGGVLTTESLVVRNLTREVEWFIPLALIMSPEMVFDSGPGWLRLVSMLWVVGFLILPLLNRERRRIGDLLAGTMVVREPRAQLLSDLTASTGGKQSGLRFTPEQLEKYGVYELQVLEDLLREKRANRHSFAVVAQKIRRKIGWQGAEVEPERFLRAFYEAQRSRLEHDLLLGRARERKDAE